MEIYLHENIESSLKFQLITGEEVLETLGTLEP